MLRPGQQVGNYRVEGLVGRGGQGIVYRAVHTRLGTTHALKLLLMEIGPLRDRLLEEGRIQARLRHPHVVPVTDVVEVDGALGLVAEYVQGAPLDVWLAAEERPLGMRLDVFRDVCRGVAAAHAARIVHRDLKPGNVLVEDRDGRPVARVTDFGVAKVLDDARASGATLPGMAIGTPGYMAPEQLRDAATVDARADVFALGCLLHELITGIRAWNETDVLRYAVALESGRRTPLGPIVGLPARLAERIEAIVTACVSVDPADRPTDAADLLSLLDGERPVPTPLPRPPVQRTPTFVPGAPPVVPPTPAPVLAPDVGAGRTLLPPRLDRNAPTVEAEGGPGGAVVGGGVVGGAGAGGGVAGGAGAGSTSGVEDPWAEPTAPRRSWGVLAAVALVLAGSAFAAAVVVDGGGASEPGVAVITPAAPASVADAVERPSAPDGAADAGDAEDAAPDGTRTTGPAARPLAATSGTDGPPPADAVPPRDRAPGRDPGSRAAPTEPTPARAPQDAPAPSGPRPGRVVVEGDGKLEWLVVGETQVTPSSAPPGHYTMMARFGAEGLVDAGTVSVQEGATVRVRCDAFQARCITVPP